MYVQKPKTTKQIKQLKKINQTNKLPDCIIRFGIQNNQNNKR